MKRIFASKSRREKIGLIGKLITALLFAVVMFLTIGVVQVKDSRKNASYCANCHDDSYLTWESDGDSYSLAYHHADVSISCQTCHDRTIEESLTEIVNYTTGNYSQPFSTTDVSEQLCIGCHGSLEEVAAETTQAITGEPLNPHEGHIDVGLTVDMSCTACHKMHSDSTNECEQCHMPFETTPGWASP